MIMASARNSYRPHSSYRPRSWSSEVSWTFKSVHIFFRKLPLFDEEEGKVDGGQILLSP